MSASTPLTPQLLQALSELASLARSPSQLTSQRDESVVLKHSSWRCEGSRGFMVLTSGVEPKSVSVYVASGKSLGRQLEQPAQEALYALGFKRRTAADPFELTTPVRSESERVVLVAMVEQLLTQVCLKEGERAVLSRFEAQSTTLNNTPLLEAMKRLSRERSHSARQKLYWAFVRARLLLALEGEGAPSPTQVAHGSAPLSAQLKGLTPLNLSELTGYPSAAVFCSWESARRFRLKGVSVVEVKGRALLPYLLSHPSTSWGSVLINPLGQVGGEFYRNELSAMDEAMTTWEGS